MNKGKIELLVSQIPSYNRWKFMFSVAKYYRIKFTTRIFNEKRKGKKGKKKVWITSSSINLRYPGDLKATRIASYSREELVKDILMDIFSHFKTSSELINAIEIVNRIGDKNKWFFLKKTVRYYNLDMKANYSENELEYEIKIRFEEHDYCIKIRKMGLNKDRERGAFYALISIFKHFKADTFVISDINEFAKEMFLSKAKNTIVQKESTQDSKSSNARTNIFYGDKRQNPDNEKVVTKEIDFSRNGNILYIVRGRIGCQIKKHKIESATGYLRTLREYPVKLNVQHCIKCNRFFISLDEFIHYRDVYGGGILLGSIRIDLSRDTAGFGTRVWGKESPLHMCGYNVNQQQDLSNIERRKILKMIMDYKILSKGEIMEYLHFFIRQRANLSNMEEAIKRWDDDLNWLRDYGIISQNKYNLYGVKG